MTTASLNSDTAFRLRELHSLFLSEFDRRATDNALKLLKQIGKEARGAPAVPDVPTATPEGRLTFLRAMYDYARKHRFIDRQMQLLECMRAEDSKR